MKTQRQSAKYKVYKFYKSSVVTKINNKEKKSVMLPRSKCAAKNISFKYGGSIPNDVDNAELLFDVV